MRVLLDTNVLIDIYTNRSSGDALSRRLLLLDAFGDAEFWASASCFTDMFFILGRFFKGNVIQDAFRESFRWLHICSVDSSDITAAANQQWDDFEDCVINTAAMKVKADFILTRNKKDFTQSTIPAKTPSELFDYLERDYKITYDEVAL